LAERKSRGQAGSVTTADRLDDTHKATDTKRGEGTNSPAFEDWLIKYR